jgi:hypothetical protein
MSLPVLGRYWAGIEARIGCKPQGMVIDAHAPKAKEFRVDGAQATSKAGSSLRCFRPLSIREEGTLHPVGLVAAP